jgi:hypothetical protein
MLGTFVSLKERRIQRGHEAIQLYLIDLFRILPIIPSFLHFPVVDFDSLVINRLVELVIHQ